MADAGARPFPAIAIPVRPTPRIVVIGLGYVGLSLAVTLARHFPTIGFDIDGERLAELRAHHDRTSEIPSARLASSTLDLTDKMTDCRGADIYIVTVPTPVDAANRPDMTLLVQASRTVGEMLCPTRPAIVVFESTVYPGVTEDICGPAIAAASGLERGRGFFLGYSPERINPGDRERTVDRIVKVVSGESDTVVETLRHIYGSVTSGGVHVAASIRVAEAAKVIENAQRDVNIAFVNEVTQILAGLNLSIWDVLETAATKWNFLPFHPGLVGGHCVGVDPFYLAHCAQALGHAPVVTLAGRRTNDGMATWIADCIDQKLAPRSSILMLGVTFKENVPDLRNSKVLDMIARLRALGHDVAIHDPVVDHAVAQREVGEPVHAMVPTIRFDALVVAVPHAEYRGWTWDDVTALLHPGGLVADIKRALPGEGIPSDLTYWTL
jgi:UDP-N-acetyl-D-galactosamine dehydrogenase